jgi:hypothetical protein
MGLNRSDFELTDAELARIDSILAGRAARRAMEGEDPPSGVRIVFDFVPGLGRIVSLELDGAEEVEVSPHFGAVTD